MSARCMFKIDLQKAYDTAEWSFVQQMLVALKFPSQIREMLVQCITTSSFTLSLNREKLWIFHADMKGFKYQPLCKDLKLTNFMFAEKVLMFCKGDANLMMQILKAFSTFSKTSGLKLSASKSNAYFIGVPTSLKEDILKVSGFKEGSLSFKYLGMPIQTTRLRRKDYGVLIEK
ncbi:uncharacterized protein LOC141639402, partial [Silene latifolia]|uniref:uncharacterized protein LOC141639402 n=1 Tax=Silene latifolia TaxID=37657 RepID=UPI003D773239